MITKDQIRAARALLDWSQNTLAEKCPDVSAPTIKLIESGRSNSTPGTLGAIQKTLEDAGLEFLPQNGVRQRDDLVTIIEKQNEEDNVYLRLLDDIYYTVKGSYGEVLYSFVDNALSSQEVVAKEEFIRNDGITFRHLVRYGDVHFNYPLDEYRYLPKGFYLNNPTAVYGTKVAFNVQNPNDNKEEDSVIIINNHQIAEIKRKEFEMIWKYGEHVKGEKNGTL